MKQSSLYFCRASRAGSVDLMVRTPELLPLRAAIVALFGAGCLGATSALEFARAGVGALRVLDHDTVDPGTIARWPLGIRVAGLPKVQVLREFIALNYPSTQVLAVPHCLGAMGARGDSRTDREIVEEMAANASVIYDATAEVGVQHFLSEFARARKLPYVGVSGTYGGWGGRILCIVPGRTRGCWMCCRHAFEDGTIAEPPSDPVGEVQPRGCGDVTFTGAGFDMGQVALTAVRAAVSILCGGERGAYPASDWDVMTVAFRNGTGRLITPEFRSFPLEKHPRCVSCNPS